MKTVQYELIHQASGTEAWQTHYEQLRPFLAVVVPGHFEQHVVVPLHWSEPLDNEQPDLLYLEQFVDGSSPRPLFLRVSLYAWNQLIPVVHVHAFVKMKLE